MDKYKATDEVLITYEVPTLIRNLIFLNDFCNTGIGFFPKSIKFRTNILQRII